MVVWPWIICGRLEFCAHRTYGSREGSCKFVETLLLVAKGLALWIEIMVVVAGAWVAISNVNNLWVIKVAQVINGTLLPVFITMILWLLNSRVVMHKK